MALVPAAAFAARRIAVALALCSITVAADPALPEGYRGPPYKAPTPLEVPGAATLYFAEDVQALIEQESPVLLNVSPVSLSPPGRDGERVFMLNPDRQMRHIPGSVWLPNVGRKDLEPDIMEYFASGLRCHGGKPERPLMIYCTADCWMSWNAIKRASAELGYRRLYWYPFGIDGWKEAGLPLESAEPVPLPGCPD